MDARAIIAELDRPNGLPRDALAAATRQREKMVPLFIEEIERYIAAAPSERKHPDALFFMFHLLGEWRETEAYPTLARFLRLPEEELDRILDDAITATSNRVMISVFDGDPEPLYDIILDAGAHPLIRSRMCEALATLVAEDQLALPTSPPFCAPASPASNRRGRQRSGMAGRTPSGCSA